MGEYQNGPRRLLGVSDQHDPKPEIDFADAVYNDIEQGKLVIIDQSSGEPQQNKQAAERIMWKVFRKQQDWFKAVAAQSETHAGDERHIVVYVEEAHNLLPQGRRDDILQTVWARAAKKAAR